MRGHSRSRDPEMLITGPFSSSSRPVKPQCDAQSSAAREHTSVRWSKSCKATLLPAASQPLASRLKCSFDLSIKEMCRAEELCALGHGHQQQMTQGPC